MKYYILAIKQIQQFLLGIGILTLMVLPLLVLFTPDIVFPYTSLLYDIAHATVFFVMLIRPLADIITGTTFIRPLVILRKGFGVVSASIVVSFLLAKVLVDPIGFALGMASPTYWSLENYALIAHLADITAVILLVTSNNFSKRIMGAWWKRVQRLSYVFFYASAFYVFASYGSVLVFFYMVIITIVTLTAFIANIFKRMNSTQQPA